MKVVISYRRITCHPETCTCNNHNTWQIKGTQNTFPSLELAIQHCKENNLKYSVDRPSWGEVLGLYE